MPRMISVASAAGDPVIPPLERQGVEQTARAAVLRFHPLARLACAQVLGDVDVLPHPEGPAEKLATPASAQRLGPPVKMARPSRSTRAAPAPVAPHLRGCTVGTPRPVPDDKKQALNVPPGGARDVSSAPCRSTGLPSVAATVPRTMDPNKASTEYCHRSQAGP